jgi:adenine-specific DNA methylase
MIDRWFPIAAVDDACATPAGSGRVEKAIFTWFASRPIAQARAAVLTSLLPDDRSLKPLIEVAIRSGDGDTLQKLAKQILSVYGGKPPVVLDMFSGRAIIPLEAATVGANAVGIDLSPVATLAGRLLADYPARDWSEEPALPFPRSDSVDVLDLQLSAPDRLARDVKTVLAEIGQRVAKRLEPYYPCNQRGEYPWGYLWAITIPCDGCKRRFPLIGSLLLRYPDKKSGDPGQSLRLNTGDGLWTAEVIDGPPLQVPTYSSAMKADGKKKKGKTARCLQRRQLRCRCRQYLPAPVCHSGRPRGPHLAPGRWPGRRRR